MLIGFTGTRSGMTEAQKRVFFNSIMSCCATSFHHGDCIGADREAHDIAKKMGIFTVAHPPSNPTKRAYCATNKVMPAKPYLDRNKDIVSICDVLIACPKEFSEQIRSGTWSTIRKAHEVNKPVIIIYPDGSKVNE